MVLAEGVVSDSDFVTPDREGLMSPCFSQIALSGTKETQMQAKSGGGLIEGKVGNQYGRQRNSGH